MEAGKNNGNYRGKRPAGGRTTGPSRRIVFDADQVLRRYSTMQKRLLVALLCFCLMIVTGCVSIPHEQLSRAIEIQELSDHVHFLAQPALKGRKPKTWESATARQYLKSRFEAYGLIPWTNCKGYEQPFGFGTNVIGVLPGVNPNLADEIVIVSAHYDHLGKGKKGIYHGACDNASGVAALLELLNT